MFPPLVSYNSYIVKLLGKIINEKFNSSLPPQRNKITVNLLIRKKFVFLILRRKKLTRGRKSYKLIKTSSKRE
jgi:hypothetical protein